MKIACLQFAPQVGDVDNNLNRADSVLSRVNSQELDDLDLLVLPELAFTGYNFKSLSDISPFLEPSGSGISSLWARTNALKYNCNVVVGYPEKVDPSPNWPTSPEYYNSAIMVNRDGETIANYRKSFLFMIDETWALEGKEGFFETYIPGLGNTSMGICMDLNPYKFEAPWHAFEFAFHVLDAESNIVIVSMAWLTRENAREYSRTPQEPDMDTLTYWVQRLEPVIRAEQDDEIIFVFCNRVGTEDEIMYAGTSAVIGIKEGEVSVYGVLGRGVKDLLVVDTDSRPFAKLVQRAEVPVSDSGVPKRTSTLEPQPDQPAESSPSGTKSEAAPATSPSPPSSESNIPESSKQAMKTRQLHRIHVPETNVSRSWQKQSPSSPTIGTPTAPSPTPLELRPEFGHPGIQKRFWPLDVPLPSYGPGSQSAIDAGQRVITADLPTPTSPLEEASQAEPRKTFSRPDLPLMTPPDADSVFPDPQTVNSLSGPKPSDVQYHSQPRNQPFIPRPCSRSANSARPNEGMIFAHSNPASRSQSTTQESGRTSRLGRRDILQDLEKEREDWTENSAISGWRSGSALDSVYFSPHNDEYTAVPPRPESPKSRNASRSRPFEGDIPVGLERNWSGSRASIPIAASPSIFQMGGERNSSLEQQSGVQPGVEGRKASTPPTEATSTSPKPAPQPSVRVRSLSQEPLRLHSRPSSLPKRTAPYQGETTELSRAEHGAGTRTTSLPDILPDGLPSRDASRGRQREPKKLGSGSSPSGLDGQGNRTSTSSANSSGSAVSSRDDQRKESIRKDGVRSQATEPPPSPGSDSSDEIIATIDRICHVCPVHGDGATNNAESSEHVIYEVNLPPHLRELFAATSSPLSGVRRTPNGTPQGTQSFNPPTPKAMMFALGMEQDEAVSPQSLGNGSPERPKSLRVSPELDRPMSVVW